MTTYNTPPDNRSSRRLWLALGGCALVALCAAVLAAAGAGTWFAFNRQAGAIDEAAVEYILDASPRMALPAQGSESGSRLAVAQGVLAEIIRPADPEVTAGLRVFGSGALADACRDTDLLVPLAPSTQPQISDRLLALQAGQAADAAMAEAMVAAIRDLAATGGPHNLVVVTGGADSCNPEAGLLIADEAERAGIELQLFVVGYLVSDEDAEALKGFVADTGSGTYLDAKDEGQLRDVLNLIQQYLDDPTADKLQAVLVEVTAQAAVGSTAVAGVTGEAPATPEPGATEPGAEFTEGPEATAAAEATAGPEPAMTIVPGATAQPAVGAAQSACDHPYFPLRQGATWTYSSDFGSQVWTVTSVSGDLNSATAEMQATFEDITTTYTWHCTAEGIVSYEFGNVTTAGGSAEYILTSSSGVFLPPESELGAGATWSSAYTMDFNIAIAGAGGTYSMSAQQNYTSAGSETQTVPVGTFQVLVVNGSGTFTMSGEGFPAVPSTESTFVYRFARGVGLVSSSSAAAGTTSETVLSSFYIP